MLLYLVFVKFSYPLVTRLKEICLTEEIAQQTIIDLKLQKEFETAEYFIEKWYVKQNAVFRC